MNYNEIEKKWQSIWSKSKYFEAKINNNKEKYYILVEFPYPSGSGLHVGHIKSYSALDALARLKRMQGYNVLYPMGWDAFGLPAEQYAILNKIHPKDAVRENIKVFKDQINNLGLSFDWSREINTTDPEYYKWTQWQFLKFYENNMAYKEKKEINWCNSCKIGLSNEESEGGICERCGSKVVKKEKEQWILRMSDYAEELLEGLKDTEFVDRVKTAQINWIGKSEGAELNFKLKDIDDYIRVFTTRVDTLYGVAFLVLSPEHKILDKYKDQINNYEDVITYKNIASSKTEIERTDATKEKTGIKLIGLEGVHPLTGESLPIYVSDYVLVNYAAGALMAVPAHDDRDFAFAKKYNIGIKFIIKTNDINNPYAGEGEYINSPIINGINNKFEAINKMMNFLEDNNIGSRKTNYKLQDWIFSRQRFWGEPIPMVYCDDCGWVAVPYEDLPVVLPDVASYEATDDGESPLANIDEFVNTSCPKCGKYGRRETDTMPNWAGSSWYYLRYMDPFNKEEYVGEEPLEYWNMVDYYNGGMEHATRHLLYARFWHKFFYNLGLITYSEPFKKRVAHGMILGENGEKMSKSRGNVINPNDMVKEYGADALRCYELFIGDYEKDSAWSTNGIKGVKRFIDRVYRLKDKINQKALNKEVIINKTIKKVTEDLLSTKYNTAVSSLMILTNELEKEEYISKHDYEILITLLNPMAPHVTEELNELIGNNIHLAVTKWPLYDEGKIIDEEIEIGVQVNGKLRGSIKTKIDDSEDIILEKALANDKVKNYINDKEIIKTIVIPKKIVNIVIK